MGCLSLIIIRYPYSCLRRENLASSRPRKVGLSENMKCRFPILKLKKKTEITFF